MAKTEEEICKYVYTVTFSNSSENRIEFAFIIL